MGPEEYESYIRLLEKILQDEGTKKNLESDFWHKLELRYGRQVYSDVLYYLTHLQFDHAQARDYWLKILDHRKELERLNGRDMGLRVALADFFININPTVKNPMLIEINIFQKKEEQAVKDELTGLYNRRFFNRSLQQELDRAKRFQQNISLLMIDIDHFKRFNDTYGHPSGDRALIEVAAIMRANFRSIDHLTRYGGEEFAVILPRSDTEMSLHAAERLRASVESHIPLGDKNKKLTLSIGVATFPIDATDGLSLLECADHALYTAKQEGRNRVKIYYLEKRKYTRYPVEMPVALTDVKGKQSIFGFVNDISAGGFLGRTREAVEQGKNMSCRLILDDGEKDIVLTGRCVRIARQNENDSTYQLGFQFEEGSMIGQDTLAGIVTMQ